MDQRHADMGARADLYVSADIERFSTTGSPFGFDSCLDMETMHQPKVGVVTDLVAKRS